MAASKVCASCGAVNAATNVFCIHCGRPFESTGAAQAPGPTPYPAAYPPGYPAMPPPGAPGAYPYFGPPPRRATASAILSGMFDVWMKGFAHFFLVFVVVSLIKGLLGVLVFFAIFGTLGFSGGILTGVPAQPSIDLGRAAGLFLVLAVVGVIIDSIVTGGMTDYAVRRNRGEAVDLQTALRRGFQRFLSILGADILFTLILVGVLALPVFLGFALLVAGAGLAGICLLIGGLFVGGFVAIYVGLGLSLYAPAIMMENQHAVDGLQRSWRLTRGYRPSLFASLLVTLILFFVVTLAITLPMGLLGNPFVDVAASAIASGIVGSWFVILFAVAYDLIVRQPTFVYGPPPYVPGPAAPAAGGPPGGPPAAPPPPTPPTGP